MKLFGGTTPQERAISTLIHDHTGRVGLIKSYTHMIQKIIDGGVSEPELQKIFQYTKNIEEAVNYQKSVIDAYCEKAKNDFQ